MQRYRDHDAADAGIDDGTTTAKIFRSEHADGGMGVLSFRRLIAFWSYNGDEVIVYREVLVSIWVSALNPDQPPM